MTIKRLTITTIIALVTYILWAGLEVIFYGEVQPRIVDDIIGAILLISLYYNVKQHIKE